MSDETAEPPAGVPFDAPVREPLADLGAARGNSRPWWPPWATWPRESTAVGDLKIANAALGEMAEAFRVFRPYRHVRKMTMFGSARTKPDDPIYVLARDLAAKLAEADWMVVTGAGPGIMAAGLEGAGREHAFGVNIRLPHEEEPNAFIAQDPKLVEMRYFFTRKLMLIKESHAYAVLPGGFGTQDEAFELLTLLQTGKAEPAPVVMVETPGGTYWHAWLRFVEDEAIARGLGLARGPRPVQGGQHHGGGHCRDPRLLPQLPLVPLGGRPAGAAPAHGAVARPSWPTSTGASPTSSCAGTIRATDPFPPERDDHPELPRLALRFDRYHYARLRQLIDAVNECTG